MSRSASTTDPVYREALATFEALRRLWFPAAQIFLLLTGPDGAVQVSIQLHAQKKTFTVTCGVLPNTASEIEAEWIALTTDVSAGKFPQRELDRIWSESECRGSAVLFLHALTGKGFFIPKEMS